MPINALISTKDESDYYSLKKLDTGNARLYKEIDLYGNDAISACEIKLETKTINDILISTGYIEKIKFLKTDVESMDMPILNASLDVIKKNKPIIFFECHIADAYKKEQVVTFLSFIKKSQ